MLNLISPTITFLSAALITYFGVYGSVRFHNFFFLISSELRLFLYCITYGIIGVVLLYILKQNVITISDDNTKIGNYLYPFAIGVSTKGISELNLFNIKTKNSIIPFGIKSATQLIDNYFEEVLEGLCFRKAVEYQYRYIKKYENELSNQSFDGNIEQFKTYVINELKRNHPDKTKTGAFEVSDDFRNIEDIKDLLSAVLREFGPDVFNAVFPL